MEFFDLARTRILRAIPMQKTKTIETKESDKIEEQSIEDMVEMGRKDLTKGSWTTKLGYQQSKERWRTIILRYAFHAKIAMAGLFCLIIILSCLFALSKSSQGNKTMNSTSAASSNTPWYKKPHISVGDHHDDPIPVPVSPPVSMPESTSSSGAKLPESTSNPEDKPATSPLAPAPTGATINERIVAVVDDPSELYDLQSPVGRAYRWLEQQDERRLENHYATLVQRFTLAVFYFSTGGGRISATWESCSAVPTEVAEDLSSFGVQCIVDLGVENQETLCADREAFLECKEYYEGEVEPSEPKRRWLSGANECDWYGVSCNQNGLVEELILPDNGLVGMLPRHLDLLVNMKTLILDGNQIEGKLPEWRGVSRMETVSLSRMNLEGSIPESWSNWSNLQTLEISENRLSGRLNLPGQWMNLYKINVHNNNFEIEFGEPMKDIETLTELHLHGNHIGSSFPESIVNLKNMKSINFSGCSMTGTLPTGIGGISNLVELEIQDNFIEGTIPESLWSLTNLRILKLGPNYLSGTLSRDVGNLQQLEQLTLNNLNLSGTIPDGLGNLSALESAQLEQNGLDGQMPSGVCDISGLGDLRADCRGSGSISCSCCTVCCDRRKGNCREQRL